jgi:hypothetical protein
VRGVGWCISSFLLRIFTAPVEPSRFASSVLASYSRGVLNLEHRENVMVGQHTLDDKDYEGVNSLVDSNKCT